MPDISMYMIMPIRGEFQSSNQMKIIDPIHPRPHENRNDRDSRREEDSRIIGRSKSNITTIMLGILPRIIISFIISRYTAFGLG
jgi:hypothetical protein